jgi:hypothetical protein
MIIIIGKFRGFQSYLESRSQISAKNLTLCYKICFLTTLLFFRRKHIDSRIGNSIGGVRLLCLDCILCLFQSERVVYTLSWPWSLDLNTLKDVCNHTREMFVDNCRLWLYDSGWLGSGLQKSSRSRKWQHKCLMFCSVLWHLHDCYGDVKCWTLLHFFHQMLIPQLDPLTEQQLVGMCNL